MEEEVLGHFPPGGSNRLANQSFEPVALRCRAVLSGDSDSKPELLSWEGVDAKEFSDKSVFHASKGEEIGSEVKGDLFREAI